MKDFIDIICWFISLAKGFVELLGYNSDFIEELTGKIKDATYRK